LARKKKKSSRNDKERKKKGDLAREFDETSGGILSKFKIPDSPIQSNESTSSSVATSDIGSIATATDDDLEEEHHIEEEEQTPPVPPDLDVIPSDLNEGSSLDVIPSALNEGEPSPKGQPVGINNTSLSSPSTGGLTEMLQVCNTIHGEFTSLQNEVMSLLLSDNSTVQSLNISSSKQNQLKCDICQSTTHPTLRCKVLTEDSNTSHVSIEMIQILNKLKNKLDVEQRENALYISNLNANTASNLPLPPPRAAPLVKKGSDISNPNERQPTDGAVCQGSSEIITEQTPPLPPQSSNNAQQPAEGIKLDKFGNEINPEKDKIALNAFLTNPSGMNWEDLVRSMKKKTGLEALVGQELVIDLNDDNVSDLDADPQEDEGSYKYTGDLSCMGNILSNYMRRKKSEGNDDGDSTLCDPLCDDDTSISSKDDESEVRSWGGKESSEDEAEDEPENDLVEKVIACQLSPKEEVSPLRSPRQHDTLEKNIERVILGQDQEELKHMYEQEKQDKVNPKSSTQEEEAAAAAAAENKPIAPLSPPRSSSMTPRSRWAKARGGAVAAKRPNITSGSSSAFSPIKLSSPTTPITASLETTFDSSEFSDPFKSSSSFSSPQRVRSKSTPPSKFRSIEPPPSGSPQQEPFSPEPISPRPQRSPKRGRSVDSRAHHNVNVAPRIPSGPSEPPVLIMSMSADDESSYVDMDQPLLLGSTDRMDISAMKQESLLDEPPKIIPSVDDVDEETFHQQIRGATPSLLNDKDLAVAASTANNKKEEDTPSTVAPFPTSFDASETNNNRNLNKKNSSENGKAVLLGWVDDNGNLVYGEQEKEAASNRQKDSNELDAKQTLSTSLRSVTDHEEEVDDSVDGRRTPRLFILPQSLSINREKKVTCWEMAFHRIRRTKGEF